MFDNDYVLLEELFDSLNQTVNDSDDEIIFGRLYSGILKKFLEGLPSFFEVDDSLRDNSNNWVHAIQDSTDSDVEDHQYNDILAKYYSSDEILDSKGRPIDVKGSFSSFA